MRFDKKTKLEVNQLNFFKGNEKILFKQRKIPIAGVLKN